VSALFNQEQFKPTNKMKLTEPLPDTEQSLFYSAINALRCAGQEAIADDLDQRMENIAKTPKIAIFVQGGMVQAVRSNIAPATEMEVEIVDKDCFQPDYEDDRWEEIQTELNFANY
jgi:hypothetical protein